MKHEKQDKLECALASCCMALEKDYRTVALNFHLRYGFTFGDAAIGKQREWLDISEEFLTEMLGARPKWFRGKMWDFTPLRNQRISLAGQGLISVIRRGICRHTMAFSKRRVYDPQEADIMTWRQWRRRNPHWKVYDVTQVEKKSEKV